MRFVDAASRARLSIVRRLAIRLAALGVVLHWLIFPGAGVWQDVGKNLSAASDWLRRGAIHALNGESGSRAPATATAATMTVMTDLSRLKAVNGYAAKELQCLALAVYYEASREQRDTQIGIAQVAMNRTAASKTPREICRTVYSGLNSPAGCLFESTCRFIGALPRSDGALGNAVDVAMDVAAGRDLRPQLAKATHFHDSRNKPGWTLSLHRIERIGKFDFYSTEFPEGTPAVAATDKAAEQAASATPVAKRRPAQQAQSASARDSELSRRVFGMD